MNLAQFIGKNQLQCMRDACRGEEGEYFKGMITDLKKTLATMPKTYETEEMGDDAPVTLHYFKGGSDWYIVERDAGGPDDSNPNEQLQAYGFACLNEDYENAEFGYISVQELIKNGVELDLYYKPETKKELKDRYLELKTSYAETGLDDWQEWLDDGQCPVIGDCGCYTELDGHCPHGSPSKALSMGLV